jgi:hypothetical protein
MTSQSWLFAHDAIAHSATSVTIQQRADEIAAEMFQRAEKRRLAFAELKSELYTPTDRISAWEKLHGLRLPSDSGHAVLAFIARSTGLTLAQVHDEQRSRNELAAARARASSEQGQTA